MPSKSSPSEKGIELSTGGKIIRTPVDMSKRWDLDEVIESGAISRSDRYTCVAFDSEHFGKSSGAIRVDPEILIEQANAATVAKVQ